MSKVVNFNDAKKLCLDYFNQDEIAADVFLGKYALRNNQGELLEPTPDSMHDRLARELHRVESKYENPVSYKRIRSLLDGFKKIIPQGSPMSAIGNTYKHQSLSNCFVVASPEDSYGGILHTDQEQAQIMKRRGGVGFDISKIRPKGLSTANAAGTTDGIGVFMERFSNTCREVAQGGRRGALMLTIDVRHPEIETFINIKRDRTKVTGANLSIKLTDDFMKAASEDKEFALQWPVDSKDPKIVNSVSAKKIWNQIIDAAWENAEPGLLFWDTVKKWTLADIYEKEGFGSISTNPCGEIVLSAYDACRLLVLNTLSYVKNPFKKDAKFDYASFFNDVIVAQRLMDDIVELELEQITKIITKIKNDPEPESVKRIELELWEKIRNMVEKGRRTGLGVTAIGDTLAYLGLRYGSEKSINVVEEIYKTLALASHKSSVVMAKERGAFPVCDVQRTLKHPFMARLMNASDKETNEMYKCYGRRNICNTTTAPAGSVSVIAQTSSGIEPIFLPSYKRRKKIIESSENANVDYIDEMGDKWQEYTVYHHGFKSWMEATEKSSFEESPYYRSTANDVDWMASVDIQAAAQKWVEHSISKTCNLPKSATKDLVANVYMSAWEKGCKGFTVYRDGCRSGVLISESAQNPEQFIQKSASRRPKELPCKIHKTKIKGENWTIIVGLLEGKPYEVFGGLSKYIEIPKKYTDGILTKHDRKTTNAIYDLKVQNGGDFIIKNIADAFDNANYSHTTRLISLSLRHGAKIQYVVEQLQKEKDADMFSFAKCISRVLKSYIEDGTETSAAKTCSNCNGTKFAYQEGCITCLECGWAKCG